MSSIESCSFGLELESLQEFREFFLILILFVSQGIAVVIWSLVLLHFILRRLLNLIYRYASFDAMLLHFYTLEIH